MEEGSQKNIYIDKEEDITEVVDKLKQVQEKYVTVVVPTGAVILQDVLNLKILQKKAKELGMEVMVSKDDSNFDSKGSVLKKSAPVLKKKSVKKVNLKPSRVSGVVKKNGIVDLRNMSSSVEVEKKVEPEKKNKNSNVKESFVNSVETSSLEEIIEKQEDKITKIVEEPIIKEELPIIKEKEKKESQYDDFWGESIKETKKEKQNKKEEYSFYENVSRKDSENKSGSIKKRKKKNKKSLLPALSSRFFAIFLLISFVTAAFALFFILPKADISIKLRSEKVASDFSLVLSENGGSAEDLVPAKTLEFSTQKSETYNATGIKTVSEKATGEITVYNECSTGTQTLVANTRFLSKEGKIFRIEKNITIPGFTKPEDEIIPGQMKVEVVAEEPGDSYNIEATTFTIPKLQELVSWKYSCLYARSESSMSGGLEEDVLYVTQSDYDLAKEDILDKVKSENDQKAISATDSDDLVFVSNSFYEDEVSLQSSHKVGEVADEFELTSIVNKKILFADRSDLENSIENNVAKSVDSEGASPIRDTLVYEITNIEDGDDGVLVDISSSESFFFKLQEDAIKDAISGKSESEFSDYFNKTQGIDSVNVNLWPFWVTSVPEAYDKINITIDINDSI